MEGRPTSASAPPRADSGNDPTVIAGWIAVIFAPIIAVIIGFLLRSKGDRRGNPILAVSLTICAIGLIVAVIVISAVSGAGSSGGLGTGCAFNQSGAARHDCLRQLDRQLRVNP